MTTKDEARRLGPSAAQVLGASDGINKPLTLRNGIHMFSSSVVINGVSRYLVLDFHRNPSQNYENNTNSRWICYAARQQTATATPIFRYRNVTDS